MELKNKWTLSGQVCTGAQVSTMCSVHARRVSHAHRNSTAGDTQTRHRDCIMYAYTESPRLGDARPADATRRPLKFISKSS